MLASRIDEISNRRKGGNGDVYVTCWIGLGVGFKLFYINNIGWEKWRSDEKIE
jgi:hypothetical protein